MRFLVLLKRVRIPFYLSSFIYCFFICYSLIIILRHYAFYNTNAAISDDRAIVLSF